MVENSLSMIEEEEKNNISMLTKHNIPHII